MQEVGNTLGEGIGVGGGEGDGYANDSECDSDGDEGEEEGGFVEGSEDCVSCSAGSIRWIVGMIVDGLGFSGNVFVGERLWWCFHIVVVIMVTCQIHMIGIWFDIRVVDIRIVNRIDIISVWLLLWQRVKGRKDFVGGTGWHI